MAKEIYWSSPNPKCDIGLDEHALNGRLFDARLPRYGQWGLLCLNCAKREGIRLGQGQGQEYALQSDGRWLKVAG